jgi:hypothetical protein
MREVLEKFKFDSTSPRGHRPLKELHNALISAAMTGEINLRDEVAA